MGNPNPNSKGLKPHLFKKGQSGNPGGRPKKSKAEYELEAMCKANTPEAVEVILQTMRRNDMPKLQLEAAKYIVDRGYGKPRQEVSGPNGKDIPIGFRVIFE